jgi:DNA-binding transcriptional regulator of glucitol operon
VVRRFAFTPRWIAWHVLMAVAVVTCVLLGDWQWLRAQVTGSMQNLAYALQWPLFAVFFAVMWWRMMRLESRRLDELAAAPAEGEPKEADRADAAPAETPATAPVADAEDPELAAYNRMLARLAAEDREASRR